MSDGSTLDVVKGMLELKGVLGEVIESFKDLAKAVAAPLARTIDAGVAARRGALRLGLGPVAFQQLLYAGAQGGLAPDALETGLTALATAAYQARTGGDGPLQRLGVAAVDAQKQLRPLQDVLGDVADRFARMPAGIERTALATELFGSTGTAMLPFLVRGRAGLRELADEAQRLGVVMSGETAGAAEEALGLVTAVTSAQAGLERSSQGEKLRDWRPRVRDMRRQLREGNALVRETMGYPVEPARDPPPPAPEPRALTPEERRAWRRGATQPQPGPLSPTLRRKIRSKVLRRIRLTPKAGVPGDGASLGAAPLGAGWPALAGAAALPASAGARVGISAPLHVQMTIQAAPGQSTEDIGAAVDQRLSESWEQHLSDAWAAVVR
jgi:hypothetical protein